MLLPSWSQEASSPGGWEICWTSMLYDEYVYPGHIGFQTRKIHEGRTARFKCPGFCYDSFWIWSQVELIVSLFMSTD